MLEAKPKADRKHAIFAPSSASRWLKCPYSAVVAAGVPERRSDAAADEGTRVHKLIEDAIITQSTAHVEDDDDLWVVELVMDYVRKLGPGMVFAERRVIVNDDVWGTTDLFHLSACGRIATLHDYKNGAYDVDAFDNKQNLSYAVGIAREFPKVEWYRLVITQPNSATRGEVQPVKQWVVPAETVAAHAVEVEQAIVKAKRGDGPVPGKHCRWCAAFGECTATKHILDYVKLIIEMQPSQIPDDRIVHAARVLRGLEDFRKLIDSELTTRLLTGKAIPGADLEPTNSFRQWRDEFAAKIRLHQLYGMDALEALSPAKAEKLGSEAKELVTQLAFKPKGKLKASY